MLRRDNRPDFEAERLVEQDGGVSVRRDRVFRHPDLLKRLAEPPVSLTDPARWNGWIPPRALPEQVCGSECGHGSDPCSYTQHRSMINNSPFRRALIDIAAEAIRRELQIPLTEDEGTGWGSN